MSREYLIYQGESFRLEWYFDAKGKSQPKDYFEKLEPKMQAKAFALFKRMGDVGLIRDITKFRNEGDEIFAFKPRPERFLSFFQIGRKMIITNAFIKKADKLPKNEKMKAIEARNDFLLRIKKGKYYEYEI